MDIEDFLASDDGKAAVEKAIDEATGGLKAKRDELLDANRRLKTELAERQGEAAKAAARASAAEATVQSLLVDAGLTEALTKARVAPEFLEAARALIKAKEEIGIGEAEGRPVAVIGEQGLTDFGNDRIAIYEITGTEGRLVGERTKGLSSPEGVAAGPRGRIYVANAGGHDLVVFEGGDAVVRVGQRGDDPGEYIRPHDIHVDDAGQVYVADPGNNRLQILTPDLDPLTSLDEGAFRFHEPKYFDIDARDWLFVADEYNHLVKIFDPDRRLVAVVGKGRSGEGADLFNYPEGVEVLGARMWVSDTRNHRIVLYRLSGIE